MTYDVADQIAKADVLLPSEEGALQEKLEQFSAYLYAACPQYRSEYDQFVSNLKRALAGSGAPGVGDRLHHFLLPNQDGKLESLQSLIEAGPLVISFNRGAWCNYCQLELQELKELYHARIAGRGALVSISPDDQETCRALSTHHALPFSVLSDSYCNYALACGLALVVPASLRELYISRGYDISKFQKNHSWMIPIPVTYVLSADGVIRHRFLNRDFRTRQNMDQLKLAFEDSVSSCEAIHTMCSALARR